MSSLLQVESLDGELKDAFADLLSLHPPEEAKQNGAVQNGDLNSTGGFMYACLSVCRSVSLPVFLFVFLPVFLSVSYILPPRFRRISLHVECSKYREFPVLVPPGRGIAQQLPRSAAPLTQFQRDRGSEQRAG